MNILDSLEFYTLWFYSHPEKFRKKLSQDPNTLWAINYLSHNHTDIILSLESKGLMVGPKLFIRKMILDEVPEGVRMPQEIKRLIDKEITLEEFYAFDGWWHTAITEQSRDEKMVLTHSDRTKPQGFSKIVKQEKVVSPSKLKKYYLDYVQHVSELLIEINNEEIVIKELVTGEYVQEWYEESVMLYHNETGPLMAQIGMEENAGKMRDVFSEDKDEQIREHLNREIKQLSMVKGVPDNLFLPLMCWLHKENEIDVVDIKQDKEYNDIFDVYFKYPSQRKDLPIEKINPSKKDWGVHDWPDIEIKFIGDDSVWINVQGGDETRDITAKEMNLRKKEWELLRLLSYSSTASEVGGMKVTKRSLIDGLNVKDDTGVNKQKSNLSKALKKYFKIDSDPIVYENAKDMYLCKFSLIPTRDLRTTNIWKSAPKGSMNDQITPDDGGIRDESDMVSLDELHEHEMIDDYNNPYSL